jgi:hypothetical protein
MTKDLALCKKTDQGKFPIITPIFRPKYDVMSIITGPWAAKNLRISRENNPCKGRIRKNIRQEYSYLPSKFPKLRLRLRINRGYSNIHRKYSLY